MIVQKEVLIENLADFVNIDVNVLMVENNYYYLKMKKESWKIFSKVKPIPNKSELYKIFENPKNVLVDHDIITRSYQRINSEFDLRSSKGNGSNVIDGTPIRKSLNRITKRKLHLL